jgi:hypothetical protein
LQVKHPDRNDYKKLTRVIKYLRGSPNLALTLKGDDARIVKWWVDASFAVNNDVKSHTGGTLLLGKVSVYSASTRQKLNTKISMEAELVGVNHDVMPLILWTQYFLDAQGYSERKTRFSKTIKVPFCWKRTGVDPVAAAPDTSTSGTFLSRNFVCHGDCLTGIHNTICCHYVIIGAKVERVEIEKCRVQSWSCTLMMIGCVRVILPQRSLQRMHLLTRCKKNQPLLIEGDVVFAPTCTICTFMWKPLITLSQMTLGGVLPRVMCNPSSFGEALMCITRWQQNV